MVSLNKIMASLAGFSGVGGFTGDIFGLESPDFSEVNSQFGLTWLWALVFATWRLDQGPLPFHCQPPQAIKTIAIHRHY
jgi:hypothetical protein